MPNLICIYFRLKQSIIYANHNFTNVSYGQSTIWLLLFQASIRRFRYHFCDCHISKHERCKVTQKYICVFLNLHFFNIYQFRRIRIVPLNLGTCSFGTFSCRLLGNLTVNTTETWQMKSIKMFYSILCECKGFLHILQDFSSMFLSKNILNILAKIAGRRWTWKTPTDVTKIKIDYILINRPDIVRDVTVINQVNIRSHQLRCECACVRLQTT